MVSRLSGYLGDGYLINMRVTINISVLRIYTVTYYDLIYFMDKSLNLQITQKDVEFFMVLAAFISLQVERIS